MSEAALRLEGVACARGGRILFEGLNLSLDAGGAALLTGPNGIGKSSLLRLCAGLLPPAAGRVTLKGECALLAEGHALDPERPLDRALGFWARIDGAYDKVAEAIAAVGLSGLERVPVRLLSTGQKKRAALARLTAGGAPVWLLDEPVNGLDSEGTEMLARIVRHHRAGGGIVVVASHVPIDLPDALTVHLRGAAA